jgi:hypothetical protein
MTAFSAVGDAFSAGAVVCASAPDPHARTPANAATAIREPFPLAIAISLSDADHVCTIGAKGDHRRLGRLCE